MKYLLNKWISVSYHLISFPTAIFDLEKWDLGSTTRHICAFRPAGQIGMPPTNRQNGLLKKLAFKKVVVLHFPQNIPKRFTFLRKEWKIMEKIQRFLVGNVDQWTFMNKARFCEIYRNMNKYERYDSRDLSEHFHGNKKKNRLRKTHHAFFVRVFCHSRGWSNLDQCPWLLNLEAKLILSLW